MRGLKNLRDELAHADARDERRWRRCLRFGRKIARRPHVKSRLRFGLDPVLVFESHVGLEHRGNADVHLRAQFPYRWKPLTRAQGALIDKLGDFEMAVDETAKAVGIKGEPVLVHPEKQRRTLLDVIFGDVSHFVPDKTKLLDTHIAFYYLWK